MISCPTYWTLLPLFLKLCNQLKSVLCFPFFRDNSRYSAAVDPSKFQEQPSERPCHYPDHDIRVVAGVLGGGVANRVRRSSVVGEAFYEWIDVIRIFGGEAAVLKLAIFQLSYRFKCISAGIVRWDRNLFYHPVLVD